MTNAMTALLRRTRRCGALLACAALTVLAAGAPPAAAQPVSLPVSTMPAPAPGAVALTQGQVLYLPIYSHIYHGDNDKDGKPQQTLLSAHVSLRNSDPNVPVRVLYARYYNTDGKLIKDYLPQAATTPLIVAPLGTLELFVPRGDTSGGSGANFLIAWRSEAPANPPIVEALHSNIQPARTITFITAARPIVLR